MESAGDAVTLKGNVVSADAGRWRSGIAGLAGKNRTDPLFGRVWTSARLPLALSNARADWGRRAEGRLEADSAEADGIEFRDPNAVLAGIAFAW